MSTLPTPLRKLLERTITEAREIAERGARKALQALAVQEADPYGHMTTAQRDLRRKLQAQARQLGDRESRTQPGVHETKHLVEKLAYDQWHRLLFARFLVENNLLISPAHGVPVTLDDCEELASREGLKDAWAVAARFAAGELPEIFRADDPAGEVDLPVEERNPLIQLVTALPVEIFTASDSLGWCYQFWQAKRKDEVNASGIKIGADELPSVTQLFTEDYMVDFLLDNTLGAWYAGRVLAADPEVAERAGSEDELREAVSLPSCPWTYLRFIRSDGGRWAPAAGTFDGWPNAVKDLTCLDPCMGSGHFVVAMFERLVSLRMAEEGIDEEAAATAVIRDNLFGLEIDRRCAQIAAFNLALAAWRRVGGHFLLPRLSLACSGLGPNANKEDWVRLASGSDRLARGMERLYELFKDAPVLGSLINPRLYTSDMHVAEYKELRPLLQKALKQERRDDAYELTVTARGMAEAAELLVRQYTLVATNVPYLGRGNQNEELMTYCESAHPDAKADLATSFVQRCVHFSAAGSSMALVTPQNWLFLTSYRNLRRSAFSELSWTCVARLGPRAFETISGEVVSVSLLCLSKMAPHSTQILSGIDASVGRDTRSKSRLLQAGEIIAIRQAVQLRNPDARLVLGPETTGDLLAKVAFAHKGLTTNDDPRFIRLFWENKRVSGGWECHQSTVDKAVSFGGREHTILFEMGTGQLRTMNAEQGRDRRRDLQGANAWGSWGVAISLMSDLLPTLYSGEKFDTNVAAIVPSRPNDLSAIWAFCTSATFKAEVRKIDQKLNVTSATLVKIPFDVAYWRKQATEKFPNGLPMPSSCDPTQWLFNGHPKGSDQPLHVAIARLLGYQWPRLSGSNFPDCPALDMDGLEASADVDGIVCLSATKGEAPAAERVRALLAGALGAFDLKLLLESAGPKGSTSRALDEWLRDEFFDQHCALFRHRPFIWQLWDGHKSGFSALVNYHKLDHANLERLTYSYLGDWIRRQQAEVDAGEAGSDARLEAAKRLQDRLTLILEGEPPFDIFVRWKPLSEQATGWNPDLNDGVRMNIRPFLAEDIPGGKRGAGILRLKPNIKWGKDRGNEPLRAKKEYPWFWERDTFTGNRVNDIHLTRAQKDARK